MDSLATTSRTANRRGRHSLALLVGLAFLATSLGLLALPPAASGWSSSSFSSGSEAQLLALTNQARASAGLRALRVDSTLAGLARWRSKDMITRGYFSHSIPPSGYMVFDVMSDRGYCFNLAGENIGWNSFPDGSATGAVQTQFMNSAGHRANILGRAWDVIGIGAYKGPTGKKMWTVLFADRCGGAKPAPRPTPRATPRPKPVPKPTVRPTVRPRPTARPTPKPTPKPRPAATPTPSSEPQPAATRRPEPGEDPGPAVVVPDDGSGPGTGLEPASDGGEGSPTVVSPGGTLRVREPAAAPGLVGSVVGGVFGFLFGP